jgi:hypothetical protein
VVQKQRSVFNRGGGDAERRRRLQDLPPGHGRLVVHDDQAGDAEVVEEVMDEIVEEEPDDVVPLPTGQRASRQAKSWTSSGCPIARGGIARRLGGYDPRTHWRPESILTTKQTRRLNGGSSRARSRRSLCLISCLAARVSNPRVSASGETVSV